jgi:hypothetical protein
VEGVAVILVGSSLVIGGIVAKGLGVIAFIFLAGLVIGVILTLSITARFRRRGSR